MSAPTRVDADALDAIARIDDGTATETDRLIARIFDRHCSDTWHRLETALDRLQRTCFACGEPSGDMDECDTCHNNHELAITRLNDI